MEMEDNEAAYRAHLAALISRTRSRGHSRYYNRYLNRCEAEAAAAFPRGAAAARRKNSLFGVLLASLGALFSFLG